VLSCCGDQTLEDVVTFPTFRASPSYGTRSLVLVGMMGAGKSSVGRRLAARLQLPFVDSDRMVEDAAQLSIQEIFEYYGEAAFRDCERRVIARLLETPSQVIALGGGAWTSAETREAVAAKGISIWLDVNLATLLERVQRRTSRPLLRNENPAAVLAKLDLDRRPIYALADIHMKIESGSQDRVVTDLIRALSFQLM
jgi:shikimate kinase